MTAHCKVLANEILADCSQNRQSAKINFPPKFPAIRYFKLSHSMPISVRTENIRLWLSNKFCDSIVYFVCQPFGCIIPGLYRSIGKYDMLLLDIAVPQKSIFN